MLAFESLKTPLRVLGQEAPQVLVYIDKGLGASILRAGVRLWDDANPSPVAAIKVTRHNLGHPTALFHETGHQFGHQTGWTAELADRLESTLHPRSAELAAVWRGWASEIAADVFAFATTGWAPLPALANVIDGTTPQVDRFNPFDPHPIAWLRVILNGALCRSWYGVGPWDTIVRAWWERHPPESAPAAVRLLIRQSVDVLGDLVDVLTRSSMTSLGGGRPLYGVVDPARVSPGALRGLARQAGATMLTSSYQRMAEQLRLVAVLATEHHFDMSSFQCRSDRLSECLRTLDPQTSEGGLELEGPGGWPRPGRGGHTGLTWSNRACRIRCTLFTAAAC